MKALLVAPKWNYGKRARGLSYEFENFQSPLEELGVKVKFFDSWDREKFESYEDLEKKLIDEHSSWNPDFVLWFQVHYEISYETIYKIRTRCPVLIWATDDSWKFKKYGEPYIRHVDYYLTTDDKTYRKYSKIYNNIQKVSWGVPGLELTRAPNQHSKAHKISFVGSKYGNRTEYISYLKKNGIEVYCAGHGWGKSLTCRTEISEIIKNSDISLNFSGSNRRDWPWFWRSHRQIKARLFEVPANGSLLLSEETGDEENYFRVDGEIYTFKTKKELVAKIKWLVENPTIIEVSSKRSFDSVVEKYTYEKIFGPILEIIRSRKSSNSVPWIWTNQTNTNNFLISTRSSLAALYNNEKIPVWLRIRTEKLFRTMIVFFSTMGSRKSVGIQNKFHRILTFYGDL